MTKEMRLSKRILVTVIVVVDVFGILLLSFLAGLIIRKEWNAKWRNDFRQSTFESGQAVWISDEEDLFLVLDWEYPYWQTEEEPYIVISAVLIKIDDRWVTGKFTIVPGNERNGQFTIPHDPEPYELVIEGKITHTDDTVTLTMGKDCRGDETFLSGRRTLTLTCHPYEEWIDRLPSTVRAADGQ